MISSTGGVAEKLGGILGQYDYGGEFEGAAFYVQAQTPETGSRPRYMYRREKSWYLGEYFGSTKLCCHELYNSATHSDTDIPPTQGWKYFDSEKQKLNEDPSLIIKFGPEV